MGPGFSRGFIGACSVSVSYTPQIGICNLMTNNNLIRGFKESRGLRTALQIVIIAL